LVREGEEWRDERVVEGEMGATVVMGVLGFDTTNIGSSNTV
jgi:hypothetical protein